MGIIYIVTCVRVTAILTLSLFMPFVCMKCISWSLQLTIIIIIGSWLACIHKFMASFAWSACVHGAC